MRFEREPRAPAAAAPPRWRSSFALTDSELAFLELTLAHREEKMLRGTQFDDKTPVPPVRSMLVKAP